MIEIASILCAVDLSPASDQALVRAVAAARWYEAKLTVLHVLQRSPAVDVLPAVGLHSSPAATLADIGTDLIIEAMHRRITRLGAPALDAMFEVVEAPDVAGEVLAQARRLESGLVVLGSHRRTGIDRLMLGSVAETVLRRAVCPVMVVGVGTHEPDPARGPGFREILCPIDFSDGSIRSLEFAYSLAEEADSHLRLLHVVEVPAELTPLTLVAPPEGEVLAGICAEQSQRLRRLVPESVRAFCHVHEQVSVGAVPAEILRTALERHSDVIVMGVMGRGAVNRAVFGSTTHRVLHAAACPVITVAVH